MYRMAMIISWEKSVTIPASSASPRYGLYSLSSGGVDARGFTFFSRAVFMSPSVLTSNPVMVNIMGRK